MVFSFIRYRTWDTRRNNSELENFYDINLSDTNSCHPADPLRCHLLEIHPATLTHGEHNSGDEGNRKSENVILLDPRTGRQAPKVICDFSTSSKSLNKTLFSRFTGFMGLTQKSLLTVKDHRICLNAIEKLHQSDLSFADREDIQHYNALVDLRREEKATFMAHVKSHLEKNASERASKINTNLEEFVMHKWKLSVIEVFRQLSDSWYRLQAGLPLTPTVSTNTRIERVLFEEDGFILRKRRCVRQKFLYKTTESLINWYDSSQEARQKSHIRGKCQTLANDNQVDVVLPLSALCLLIDTASNCSTNWMMAFRVEDRPESSIFDRKTRITFEKPLPPTTMTAMDIQNVAFKYLLRATVAPHTDKLYSCKDQVSLGTATIEIVKEAAKCGLDDPNLMEYKCQTADEYLTGVYGKNKDWIKPKGNTVYGIWDLHEDDDKKSCSDQKLRILLTSKYDSYEKETDGPMRIVNYSAKVELQAEFGAGQMTKSELIREWCRQYFRPNAVTDRGKWR